MAAFFYFQSLHFSAAVLWLWAVVCSVLGRCLALLLSTVNLEDFIFGIEARRALERSRER